jgi:hypothetical protein
MGIQLRLRLFNIFSLLRILSGEVARLLDTVSIFEVSQSEFSTVLPLNMICIPPPTPTPILRVASFGGTCFYPVTCAVLCPLLYKVQSTRIPRPRIHSLPRPTDRSAYTQYNALKGRGKGQPRYTSDSNSGLAGRCGS